MRKGSPHLIIHESGANAYSPSMPGRCNTSNSLPYSPSSPAVYTPTATSKAPVPSPIVTSSQTVPPFPFSNMPVPNIDINALLTRLSEKSSASALSAYPSRYVSE